MKISLNKHELADIAVDYLQAEGVLRDTDDNEKYSVVYDYIMKDGTMELDHVSVEIIDDD